MPCADMRFFIIVLKNGFRPPFGETANAGTGIPAVEPGRIGIGGWQKDENMCMGIGDFDGLFPWSRFRRRKTGGEGGEGSIWFPRGVMSTLRKGHASML